MHGAMVRSNVLQRLVEKLLPWYDPAAEERRNAHTEDIRQRSIRARIGAEELTSDLRSGYRAMGERLRR